MSVSLAGGTALSGSGGSVLVSSGAGLDSSSGKITTAGVSGDILFCTGSSSCGDSGNYLKTGEGNGGPGENISLAVGESNSGMGGCLTPSGRLTSRQRSRWGHFDALRKRKIVDVRVN